MGINFDNFELVLYFPKQKKSWWKMNSNYLCSMNIKVRSSRCCHCSGYQRSKDGYDVYTSDYPNKTEEAPR